MILNELKEKIDKLITEGHGYKYISLSICDSWAPLLDVSASSDEIVLSGWE